MSDYLIKLGAGEQAVVAIDGSDLAYTITHTPGGVVCREHDYPSRPPAPRDPLPGRIVSVQPFAGYPPVVAEYEEERIARQIGAGEEQEQADWAREYNEERRREGA